MKEAQRARRVPTPRVFRLGAFTLAWLASLALAGCVTDPHGEIEEGRHLEKPIQGEGHHSLDLKALLVTWSDGVENRTETWNVERAFFDNGTLAIETERFDLRYRIDEPLPVGLAWDEDLSRENTFAFEYREDASIAGRLITRVASVDAASRVNVTTYEPVSLDTAGFLDLRFEGACDEGDAGCEDPDARHPVSITGRFPKPTH